jgi:hypothetical protein
MVNASNMREGNVMNRPKPASIAVDAFYDNFTCAALFGKLRIPGSPPETVDTRPANVFWADLGLEVIAHVRGAFTEIQKIVLAGAIKTAFVEILKTKSKKQTEGNDQRLESFMAEWSSYTKS